MRQERGDSNSVKTRGKGREKPAMATKRSRTANRVEYFVFGDEKATATATAGVFEFVRAGIEGGDEFVLTRSGQTKDVREA